MLGHMSKVRGVWWYICGVLLTISVVGAAVVEPLALMIFPAIAGALLFRNPGFRFAWFVGGALLVFQTGDGLSAPKLIYFAGATAAAIISFIRMPEILKEGWARRFKPALWGAILLLIWVGGVTAIHALVVEGTPVVMWARDALTYILIALAVPIGIDAATTIPQRWARRIAIVIGIASAAGFSFVWIQSRGYGSEDDIERAFLASMVACTIPIALCFSFALAGRRFKPWWLVLGTAMIVAILITGTRTGVVLAIILVGMVGAVSKERISLTKAISGLLIGIAAVVVLLPLAASRFSSAGDVATRIGSIFETLRGGFGEDRSGAIRLRANGSAFDIFLTNPLLGQGPGVYFPNPNPGGVSTNFTLDTPMMYLAKFGLLGTAVVLSTLVLIVSAALKRDHRIPWLVESTAVKGAVFAWVGILPLASTPEDKGFAISMALMLVLVGAASKNAYGAAAEASDQQESSPIATLQRPNSVTRAIVSASTGASAGAVIAST